LTVAEPFTVFTSKVVPLPAENVDTDQIVPARYLKVTDKAGLAEALFRDWRFGEDGSLREPRFVLDRPLDIAFITLHGTFGEDGRLQQILDQGRSRLKPETVKVLEDKLALIDRAIVDAQEALARDPASVYLNDHLAETRLRKLELLRRAAALAASAS